MKYAVIANGGKQYIAEEGKKIKIEKITGEYKVGDVVSFSDVLLLANDKDVKVGTPTIAGSEVKAEITRIDRAKKIIVLKYKQKSRYQKRNGHRQPFFEVKISSIK
jgi:large subunit ribosomal protein L21